MSTANTTTANVKAMTSQKASLNLNVPGRNVGRRFSSFVITIRGHYPRRSTPTVSNLSYGPMLIWIKRKDHLNYNYRDDKSKM